MLMMTPDDRFFFESATQIINNGVTLTSHNNGAVALKELEQADFAFDLLFFDLNMPVKSGFDVLGELQDVIKDRRLKIGWDGTFNGQKMNAGVYVYMITGAAGQGNVNVKGTVTLVR